MTKFLLLFSLVSTMYLSAEAQHFRCGTSDSLMQTMRRSSSNPPARMTDGAVNWMPVKIIRFVNDDGSPSVHASSAALQQNIARANSYFIHANIQLYLVGPETVVTRTSALDVEYANTTEAMSLYNEFKDPEIFEIFVIDRFVTSSGETEGIAGVAYGSDFTFLASLNIKTFMHEIGHCLSLDHTFSTGNGIEKVTRGAGSNCATAGDGICDTHADPNGLSPGQFLGESLDYDQCSMTSDTRDLDGNLYTPPFDNIMSYFHSCGMAFTAGQYNAMNSQWQSVYEGNLNENISSPAIVGVPSGINAAFINHQVVISWTNVTGGLSTQIDYSTDGTNFTTLDGLTEGTATYALPNYTKGQNYYVRLRHLNSSPGTYSAVTQINPPVSDDRVYCLIRNFIHDGTSSTNGIGGVKINYTELNNNSNEVIPYAYYDDQTAKLMPGASYKLTVRAHQIGASFSPALFVVFIDFDQSGTFDPDEKVYPFIHDNVTMSVKTVDIAIPSDASPGMTRMRIMANVLISDVNNTPGCGLAFEDFEVEDYLVQILDPTISATNLTGTFSSADNAIKLNWNFPDVDGYYIIHKSSDLFLYSNYDTIHITGGDFTFLDRVFVEGNTYGYKVSRLFSNVISETVHVSIPKTSDYCIPKFTGPCTFSDFGVLKIEELNTGFSLATSECKSHEDSRSHQLNVSTGQSYTLKLNTGDISSTNLVLGIWADYNQNGVFEAGPETIFNGLKPASTAAMGFSVPVSALSGTTVLRVMVALGPNSAFSPCLTTGFDGQAEDITLLVSNGLNPGLKNFTGGYLANSLNFSWEHSIYSSVPDKLVIESSSDGVSFTILTELPGSDVSYSRTPFADDRVFRIYSVKGGVSSPLSTLVFVQGTMISGITTGYHSLPVVTIYPNPNDNGILQVESDKAIQMFRVLNLEGKVVTDWKNFTPSLDFQGFKKGIYYVQFMTDDKVVVIPVVMI